MSFSWLSHSSSPPLPCNPLVTCINNNNNNKIKTTSTKNSDPYFCFLFCFFYFFILPFSYIRVRSNPLLTNCSNCHRPIPLILAISTMSSPHPSSFFLSDWPVRRLVSDLIGSSLVRNSSSWKFLTSSFNAL